MIIKLTTEELQLATRVASLRSGSKSHLDSREKLPNSVPSMVRHLLGVKCELVIANLFDTVIDMSFKSSGDKNSPDIYLPDGLGVQVKGKFGKSIDRTFSLRTANISELISDYGVLCVAKSSVEIEVLGYFSKSTFIQKSVIKCLPWGDRRVLEPEHLSPISELILKYNKMSWKQHLNITPTSTLSSIRDLYPVLKNKETVSKMSRLEVRDYLYSLDKALCKSFSKFGNFESSITTPAIKATTHKNIKTPIKNAT